jgi:hypothetical protein
MASIIHPQKSLLDGTAHKQFRATVIGGPLSPTRIDTPRVGPGFLGLSRSQRQRDHNQLSRCAPEEKLSKKDITDTIPSA